MLCHEAREMFSPYLDKELTTSELRVFEQHLDACPECRKELDAWQEMCLALKDLKGPFSAPEGFAGAVMARVAGREKVRPWQGARRWVAAAAAAAVIAAGSIGYAARGFWFQFSPGIATVQQQEEESRQVAQNEPVNPQPGTGTNIPAVPETPQGDAKTDPDGDKQQQTATPGVQDKGKTGQEDGEQVVPPDPGKPAEQPVQVASGFTVRTFLNSEHKASSTLLKMTTRDMDEAKAKAAGLAGSYGASVRVIADQDNGQEKRFVYQITVAKEKAAGLLAELEGLGEVTSRNTSTQDLVKQFSTVLEQYQAKVAQANAAVDTEEKDRLLKEAQALEQQLLTWEQEVKQQTIILWLETR